MGYSAKENVKTMDIIQHVAVEQERPRVHVDILA
jgi:hypothetical protein